MNTIRFGEVVSCVLVIFIRPIKNSGGYFFRGRLFWWILDINVQNFMRGYFSKFLLRPLQDTNNNSDTETRCLVYERVCCQTKSNHPVNFQTGCLSRWARGRQRRRRRWRTRSLLGTEWRWRGGDNLQRRGLGTITYKEAITLKILVFSGDQLEQEPGGNVCNLKKEQPGRMNTSKVIHFNKHSNLTQGLQN